MPLSKARDRERKWRYRHNVQPMSNLDSRVRVQPKQSILLVDDNTRARLEIDADGNVIPYYD